MEKFGEATDVLGWHDLSADDVYNIAVLEYEVRRDVAPVLEAAVNSSNALQEVTKAQTLLANHEARAESWLADQAAIRGLRVATPYRFAEMQPPVRPNTAVSAEAGQHAHDISKWLSAQITYSGRTLRQLAELTGVSTAQLSVLRNGNSSTKRETLLKLASSFAGLRGLSGTERDQFIADALTGASFPLTIPE